MAVAFPCVNISVCWGCNRLGSWNSRSYFSHSSGGWKTRSGYKHVRVLGRALFLTCRQQPSLPVFTWPFSACIHCFCCSVAKSCLSLCDPMDCSPPGSSVHEILQARILEWVAIPFSRGSSQPRDQTWVYLHCRQILYHLSHQGSPSHIDKRKRKKERKSFLLMMRMLKIYSLNFPIYIYQCYLYVEHYC